MHADIFLDSNICLYIFDDTHPKFAKTKELLESRPTISTQVILENVNVCLKKLKSERAFAVAHARSLQSACIVKTVSTETMTLALKVFEKYGYSIFDSLIIAAALEAGCHTLYTEDMQHGQVIEGTLKITNPFL
jgi:predicted nucleic acid-binding protein